MISVDADVAATLRHVMARHVTSKEQEKITFIFFCDNSRIELLFVAMRTMTEWAKASKGVSCHVCSFLVVRLIESSSQHTHAQCLCGHDGNATLSVVWCCWLNLTTSKDKKGRNSDHVQVRRHSAWSYIKRNKKKRSQKDSQRSKAKQIEKTSTPLNVRFLRLSRKDDSSSSSSTRVREKRQRRGTKQSRG